MWIYVVTIVCFIAVSLKMIFWDDESREMQIAHIVLWMTLLAMFVAATTKRLRELEQECAKLNKKLEKKFCSMKDVEADIDAHIDQLLNKKKE